jgi:hypothetical protein
MNPHWEPGQKAEVDLSGWTCRERIIKSLRHIMPAFYPKGWDFHELTREAGKFEASMEAFAVVYYGRGSQCIGQPYDASTGQVLSYTGYEGWLEGTHYTRKQKVKIIANAGYSYRQWLAYHTGGEKNKERIDEYFNVIRGDDLELDYREEKERDEFISYAWLLHNYLFNQSREQFKHMRKILDAQGEEQYRQFYTETYQSIRDFPPFEYAWDALAETFTMSLWLPKCQLTLFGEQYPVSLTTRQVEGLEFIHELNDAGLPPIAAAIERWKGENPHWLQLLHLKNEVPSLMLEE